MVFGGFTMRLAPKVLSCLFVLQAGFTIPPEQVKADTKDVGEPQMVWVTCAQGQVKFSPGQDGEAKLGKEWIEANRGQVMENGYTLVTENGRAEVEFEDGSTAYLAEHSALVFNWLWVNGKGTDTELNLLAGKMTVAHEASEIGTLNRFFVQTPAFRLRMMRKQTTTMESAVDGSVFEAVERTQMVEHSSVFGVLKQGEAIAYVRGQPATLVPTSERTPEQKEWDEWVAGRLAAHRALIAEGLRESGLEEPVPGLAGLVEEGHFYDCPPNGKCWEPNAEAGPPVGYLPPQTASLTAVPEAFAASAVESSGIQNSTASKQGTILVNQAMMTRCPMETWQSEAQNAAPGQYGTCMAGTWNTSQLDPNDPCWRRDPSTRKVFYRPECDFYSYNTWVAGRRHRHECRFAKVKEHGIGFVPRHAADVKGHSLVDVRSGIFVIAAEKGHVQTGVEVAEPGKGVHEEGSVPQGMVRELAQSAPRVAQPVIEARTASAILPKGTLVTSSAAAKNISAIRLDYKSGNFVGRTGEGATTHSVVAGHAGGSGGISGGGSHGSSGGGSSGGGSGGGHSGGGASAGGGGHH
jgi:FecR protein